MELEIINKNFAICKIDSIQNINFNDEYIFIGKTTEEISLVCQESSIPSDIIECEKGWQAFKITGILDFSLVGILAKISSLLAENGISIFAISTFNTDYILVKSECIEKAMNVLKEKGYIIR